MSQKISLRDIQANDLLIFFDHQADPAASQMAAFQSRSRDAFMAHWVKILKDKTIFKQAILCDGRAAGNIVCYEMHEKREVGYWVGKEYWGKGVATQALALFLKTVQIRPLYAYTTKHNIGSFRVLQKCGFKVIGEASQPASAGSPPIPEFILMLG